MATLEHKLNSILVEFARVSCLRYSIDEILDHLVLRIVDLLPVAGAGVMVVNVGDDLHFVAASNDVVLRIEEVQRSERDGPCHESYRSGRAVALPDLAADRDFPRFSARAREAGLAAVFTFPLRADDRSLGALDLYRDTPGSFSEEEVRAAWVLADVAAAYLLNARVRAEASEALAEVSHRSLHDPLTGLPNRVLLAELLGEALARATRSRRRVAVLFIDLDGFKAVNDRWGHQGGDRLLVAIAARLSAALGPGDLLARWGGDEFVGVCEDLPDGSLAADVAHQLAVAMAAPFRVHGEEVTLGSSVGIALSDRRCPVTAEQLLADADSAMYRAKRDGGGRFHQHAIGEEHSLTRPADLSAAAASPRSGQRRGVLPTAEQQYAPVYQPIIAVAGGNLSAVETLLRWRSDQPAGPAPSEVVLRAERSGAILGLGEWVLRRACHDSLRWRPPGQPGLVTSVNVSAQQVTDPGFVAMVESILDTTGADAEAICLEITESSALPDDRRTVDVLRALREIGLQLWLDDFGSGYSSLNYLRVFPIQAVKIDPRFASRLPTEHASRAIVRSVVTLCHDLGLTTIVEGVETPAELQAVMELKADAVQGFYVSTPLSAAEVMGFARRSADSGARSSALQNGLSPAGTSR